MTGYDGFPSSDVYARARIRINAGTHHNPSYGRVINGLAFSLPAARSREIVNRLV